MDLEKSDSQISSQYIYLGSLFFLSIGVLFLLFRIILAVRSVRIAASSRYPIVLIVVVSVVSLIISFILIDSFRSNYRDKIREQLVSTAQVVASGISEEDLFAVNNAIDFDSDSYRNLCEYMKRCFPLEVDFFRTTYCNILCLDEGGESGHGVAYLDQSIGVYFPLVDVDFEETKEVYETGNIIWNEMVEDVSGTYLSVKAPIFNPDGEVIGVVMVGADTYVVNEMIASMQRRVLFSIVVILLLIWIISTEMIAFYNNYSTYQSRIRSNEKTIPAHLLRILIFAVFSAFNLVSSFLPVYILRLCDLFSEGSRELIASLPMTVNIFIMGIMSLFCAGLIRRFGFRRIFILATLCSLCGNLLILLIPGYATIFVGLLLDGAGVGTITNAIYVMLTYIDDEDDRRNCLSLYNAGSLSGINMGMILGGLLATALGQRYVFLAVAIIWAILLVLGAYLVRQFDGLSEKQESENEKGISTLRFVSNKTIWSFIVLIQNPYIVFNSFVFYLVPIFCESIGYNETSVSVLLMLYSEIAVILGNKMTDKISRICGNYAMYPALAINVLAVACFVIRQDIIGLIIALVLLGLSASFGKPSQQTYYLDRRIVKEYGEDKAMGVYNFSENIGESLGPIVFARLIGSTGMLYAAFLGAVSTAGLCHYLLNGKELKKNE